VAAHSAHDLTRTHDCAVPGCKGEAEVEGGLCRYCTRLARERAQEGARNAGKLEAAALALVGLAGSSTPSSPLGMPKPFGPASS
jgi:hypothetical protein